MQRSGLFRTCGLVLALLWMPAAQADIEVTDPAGRRILLKDDGTWRVIETQEPAPAASAAEAEQPTEFAELRLLRQIDTSGGCRYEFELANTLPYEIRSLVPYFAAHRASGVVYATESVAFGPVKPGATIRRALSVAGITCSDIARLRVHGGDRCEMGELNRFSDAKGQCLARLRIEPSSTVKIEK
jgi:hypothetical protein